MICVDRFYLGHYLLGFLKLGFFILLLILDSQYTLMGFLFYIVPLIDFILISLKKVKNVSFEKEKNMRLTIFVAGIIVLAIIIPVFIYFFFLSRAK